jgi:hypothetical protein
MRHLFSIVFAAALLTAGTAHADEYRFTVPVRIENLRAAVEAGAICTVGLRSGSGGLLGVSRTAPITLTDGSYTGTVEVVVPLGSGFTAADVNNWGCSLMYRWRLPDGSMQTRSFGTQSERNTTYTRDTGQEIVSSNAEWRVFAE